MQQYLLNAKNLHTIFGTVVGFGAASLWVWPDRKSSVELDFPEEDGVMKDLADPHFSARQFKISCMIKANSRAELKSYFFGLWTELKVPGVHSLYSYDLDHTVNFYYDKMENLKKATKSMNANEVGIEFDLILKETTPDLPVYYLADHLDRFLTT